MKILNSLCITIIVLILFGGCEEAGVADGEPGGTATVHFDLDGDMSVSASSPIIFRIWEYDESSPDIDWSSPDETVRFESLGDIEDFEIDAGVQYLGFPFLDNDNNGLDAGDDLEEVYLFEFDDGAEESFTIYCWNNSMGYHQLADMDHLNYIVHVEYEYTGTQPVGEEPGDGWMTVVFTASFDFTNDSAILYAANMGDAHNERAIIGVPPGSPVYFWFFLDMDHTEEPSLNDYLSFDPSPDGTIPDSFMPVALADYAGPESIEKADADMTEILGEIGPPVE